MTSSQGSCPLRAWTRVDPMRAVSTHVLYCEVSGGKLGPFSPDSRQQRPAYLCYRPFRLEQLGYGHWRKVRAPRSAAPPVFLLPLHRSPSSLAPLLPSKPLSSGNRLLVNTDFHVLFTFIQAPFPLGFVVSPKPSCS